MDERAATTEPETAQLRLIDGSDDARRPRLRTARGRRSIPELHTGGWILDRETRERGLEGVARARQVLEHVRPADAEPRDHHLPRAS